MTADGTGQAVGATLPAEADSPTTPQEISAHVVASFAGAPDPRLRYLMQTLVRLLHSFVIETGLTPEEWRAAVDFLAATGQMSSATRQEFILLSDTLGVSMVLDAVNHPGGPSLTESTVLGPFYVAGSPDRDMGESISEMDGNGEPALVSGTVRDARGDPIGGAILDVWQNSARGTYAVQDDTQPPENLRGRFRTSADGRFWFWSVRPTDYAIPDDGPVGRMLKATNRHPWRAAHLHLIVSAEGFVPVVTHLFDDESRYLESDTVFGVKRSLVCHYLRHDAGEPGAPAGLGGSWYTLERDIVLAEATG
jgi:protocatechuate 3,4-dioxygenase beta subunit